MQFLEQRRDQALALFRIVIGLFFLIHGVQKILKGGSLLAWPAGPASLIELIGGALVLIGLWTRWAALISSGAMAYAYFVVHQPRGLLPIQNGGELAAVYSWAFLLLVFTGAGAWSVDQLRKSGKKSLTNV
ncbi:DoxX family protein [Lentzea aerocolonigenes]|uniref:DoxX family protein n=1 Tax=Lentzea aerocolonigenes TaxID=68170 RepID=UPI000567133A|nr:DoxX family protein [Lentzea aerocolonigenes]MCP2244812.1 putative oxidoreductase [Lentzea aerocolonigenes]MCP2245293.1 putative oxidoreductase [Lentzea aerocolonigenes]